MFQIGDLALDPLAQLIDEDPRIDLATIRLSDDQVRSITRASQIGSCVYAPAKGWPPEPLRKGDFVAFGGFPGKYRIRTAFDEITFETWSTGASEVSAISETRFISAFERGKWLVSFGNPRNLTFSDLGGISGGPAFIDRGLYWDLAGFVTDYGPGLDTVIFASAQVLLPDGRIRRTPI